MKHESTNAKQPLTLTALTWCVLNSLGWHGLKAGLRTNEKATKCSNLNNTWHYAFIGGVDEGALE